MRRALPFVLSLFTVLAFAGAKPKPAAKDAALQGDWFQGLLIPLNATDVLAPEASFRVAGWNSSSGMLKLLELKPDGSEVKAGEVLARFEFIGKNALQYVNERLQRAQADRAQAQITTEQTLEALRSEARKRALEAQLAALDVQKEAAISRRQAELYKIALRIAEFEADAVRQRLGSAQRTQDAELAYQEQAVQRAERDVARYNFYEKRFQLVAPHDGIVRHAYNARERRKVQKGDSIGTGQKMLSVAKDPALAVRFFVPEHRLCELSVGSEVLAVRAASGEEHRAVVKQIDFFPQELGFLMELPNLPNAREKAFAVTAEFVDAPQGLSAGTELRVKGAKK